MNVSPKPSVERTSKGRFAPSGPRLMSMFFGVSDVNKIAIAANVSPRKSWHNTEENQ